MFNGENARSVPEVKKGAPDEAAAAQADEKAKVRLEADAATDGIDDTPLPTELWERTRPNNETKDGQLDISDRGDLQAALGQILMRAKINMNHKPSYGEKHEITVENTQFFLNAPDANGNVLVSVLVRDKSAPDTTIVQHVKIAQRELDDQAEYAYYYGKPKLKNPPLSDAEADKIHPDVKNLAA